MDFRPFPKIPRLRRGCTILEKLDGTNGQVVIVPFSEVQDDENVLAVSEPGLASDGIGRLAMLAGSRNRWITPLSDNYGFAAWVVRNAEELFKLGPGRHFGEWWGNGIQRNYGLKTKHFSLFNVGRWKDAPLPSCVSLVPVLYEGPYSDEAIGTQLFRLRVVGSYAADMAEGVHFMNPEGIVVYHHASGHSYKVTLENDGEPKGAQE